MASTYIKSAIVKYLKDNGASRWGSIVEDVCKTTGMGSKFVEEALCDMVEIKELSRFSDGGMPKYQAPGDVQGKYADYNDKRLEGPTTSGTFEDDPNKRDINGPKAV